MPSETHSRATNKQFYASIRRLNAEIIISQQNRKRKKRKEANNEKHEKRKNLSKRTYNHTTKGQSSDLNY